MIVRTTNAMDLRVWTGATSAVEAICGLPTARTDVEAGFFAADFLESRLLAISFGNDQSCTKSVA